MRLMRCLAAAPILVTAAHSRTIAPGDVVDFDEIIRPRDGATYDLETALGPGTAVKFEAAAAETAPAEEPAGAGRSRHRRKT